MLISIETKDKYKLWNSECYLKLVEVCVLTYNSSPILLKFSNQL